MNQNRQHTDCSWCSQQAKDPFFLSLGQLVQKAFLTIARVSPHGSSEMIEAVKVSEFPDVTEFSMTVCPWESLTVSPACVREPYIDELRRPRQSQCWGGVSFSFEDGGVNRSPVNPPPHIHTQTHARTHSLSPNLYQRSGEVNGKSHTLQNEFGETKESLFVILLLIDTTWQSNEKHVIFLFWWCFVLLNMWRQIVSMQSKT